MIVTAKRLMLAALIGSSMLMGAASAAEVSVDLSFFESITVDESADAASAAAPTTSVAAPREKENKAVEAAIPEVLKEAIQEPVKAEPTKTEAAKPEPTPEPAAVATDSSEKKVESVSGSFFDSITVDEVKAAERAAETKDAHADAHGANEPKAGSVSEGAKHGDGLEAAVVQEGHGDAHGAAHGDGHGSEGHEEHSNDLDVSRGVNLLIILFALFVLLAKGVRETFDRRTIQIREELDSANRLREEAQAELKRVLDSLGDAEKSLQDALAEGKASAEKERAEILAAANREAAKIEENARRRIADETAKARRELQAYVVNLASEKALESLTQRMSPELQETLISNVDLKSEGKA